MNTNIFRAYDIRGHAEKDLNSSTIEKIGYALGLKIKENNSNSVYIGYDSRLSCEEIKSNLIRGINAAGVKVLNLGLVPTPIVYYATKVGDTSNGIMITGSHNPKDDNGLKMVINDNAISGIEIKESVENLDEIPTNDIEMVENSDLEKKYIEEVANKVKINKKLKVVLDAGNGAAGILAEKMFAALGHEVISINKEPDGNFPNHHPDPSKEKNLIEIKREIDLTNADIGFAFDGDGDRIGLITNKGESVIADQIIMLMAEFYLGQVKGPIVFDVKCSNQLPLLIENFGGEPVMEKTGHFNIKKRIRQTNAVMGGEMSGHIFINHDWYGFDDAIFSAVILTKIITDLDVSISELVNKIPSTHSTPELNLNVKDEEKFNMVEKFKSEMEFPNADINTIDGVRISIDNSWALLRASNTSPKLVLRFEGDTEDNLNQIKSLFENNFLRIFPDIKLDYH
tara:strand:+ start:3366 stop:4730 length:1365 start_codon:yes stop_codon:yes gene_type:complete